MQLDDDRHCVHEKHMNTIDVKEYYKPGASVNKSPFPSYNSSRESFLQLRNIILNREFFCVFYNMLFKSIR